MPQIQQTNIIDITPQKFIDQCSQEELIELQLLISSPSVQHRINTPSDNLRKILPSASCQDCAETKDRLEEKAQALREAIIKSTDTMVSDHLRAQLRKIKTDTANIGTDCERCQDKI